MAKKKRKDNEQSTDKPRTFEEAVAAVLNAPPLPSHKTRKGTSKKPPKAENHEEGKQ